MAGACKASSLECSASIAATVSGTDGADGAHGVGGVGGAVRSSCHLRLLPARLSSRRRSLRRMRRVLTKTRRTSNPIHTNTGVDTRDGAEGGDGEWPSSVAFMRVADPRPSPPVPPERVRHFVSSSVCPEPLTTRTVHGLTAARSRTGTSAGHPARRPRMHGLSPNTCKSL